MQFIFKKIHLRTFLTGNDYERAIELYLSSLENSESAVAWYNLSSVYIQLGKHKEAIEALKASAVLEPEHSDVHINLGNLLAMTGRSLLFIYL